MDITLRLVSSAETAVVIWKRKINSNDRHSTSTHFHSLRAMLTPPNPSHECSQEYRARSDIHLIAQLPSGRKNERSGAARRSPPLARVAALHQSVDEWNSKGERLTTSSHGLEIEN